MLDQNLIVGLVVLAVVVLALYAYAPKLKGVLSGLGLEGFADAPGKKQTIKTPGAKGSKGGLAMNTTGPAALAAAHALPAGKKVPVPAVAGKNAEGFADFASVGDSMGAGADGGGEQASGLLSA